jgi:hypothetical protein
MPGWVLPLLGLIALLGFIAFAFRQGMKVKPHDNPDNWPSSGGGQADGS